LPRARNFLSPCNLISVPLALRLTSSSFSSDSPFRGKVPFEDGRLPLALSGQPLFSQVVRQLFDCATVPPNGSLLSYNPRGCSSPYQPSEYCVWQIALLFLFFSSCPPSWIVGTSALATKGPVDSGRAVLGVAFFRPESRPRFDSQVFAEYSGQSPSRK